MRKFGSLFWCLSIVWVVSGCGLFGGEVDRGGFVFSLSVQGPDGTFASTFTEQTQQVLLARMAHMGSPSGQIIQTSPSTLDVLVPMDLLTGEDPNHLFEAISFSVWTVEEDFKVPDSWMQHLIVATEVAGETTIQKMAKALSDVEPPLGMRRVAWDIPKQQGQSVSLLPLVGVPVFTHDHVVKANVGVNDFQDITLSIDVDAAASQRLRERSTEWVGKRMAIVANGTVLSAPVIMEPLTGGTVQILHGGRAVGPQLDERSFAAAIQSQPLPGTLAVERRVQVGPGTQLNLETP